MASSHPKPSTPFEWLAGTLLFGKAKGGIEGIDSSKDVVALLTGAQENLQTILSAHTKPDNEEESFKFLAARLSRIRTLLYDERRATSQQQSRNTQFATGVQQALTSKELEEVMPSLLENLSALPFETRKHVAAIFNYLLVCGLDGNDADLYKHVMACFSDFVEARYEKIMDVIVNGHEAPGDIAIHYGTMYRSCLRHTSLYRQLVLNTSRVTRYVFPFIDTFVHIPNFDVSSDAMESLKLVFTAGGDKVPEESSLIMAELAAEFLSRDYEATFDKRFNPKLLTDSASYMTRRVALQILSMVLLTRSNYAVMIRYVESRANLILVMKLLRDTSPHITLDAFHVFKVFVANPNKPPDVVAILRDNKIKLCQYLRTLHMDKEEQDSQFRDEKALIISTLEAL